MAINIKNREAERLLTELARRTGKGKSELVLELVRKELGLHKRLTGAEARKKAMRALSLRAAKKAARDPRTDDELIGYDEHGLPR